jgi:hypothetical protein
MGPAIKLNRSANFSRVDADATITVNPGEEIFVIDMTPGQGAFVVCNNVALRSTDDSTVDAINSALADAYAGAG